MHALHIRLFGKVAIQRDAKPLPGLSAKALELLCYLVLFRDRSHTRETLAGLLWPDVGDGLSKKYLRQTFWQLRVALRGGPDDSEPDGDPLLLLNPGWVRVNPAAPLWLDVAVLEQAHAACRDVVAENLTDAQARTLEEAAALYRGDLIESWYQDWCIYERDRLQLTYLAILSKLASWCEARRRYAEGVAHAQRILAYDPAREATHRQLMRLHFGAGDRTAALRQFDRCVAAVAKEFDLRPSRETVSLYHQLRADRLGEPPPPDAHQLDGGPDGDLLADLRNRLDHIQASLVTFQDQVQRELGAIAQALGIRQKTSRQTARETR
jgi:DNA-binding SARP family transcriptional activator